MANEKIHEYVDQVQVNEINDNQVYIDTDVYDYNVGDWVSKKLFVRDIYSPYAKCWASLFNNNNLTLPTTNTPRPLPWYNISVNSNIGIQSDGFGTPSYLVPFKSGAYKFEVTLQISRSSGGGSQQLSAWFRYNNNDISFSNQQINTMPNSNFLLVQFSAIVYMNAYDNVQVMWSVTDTGIYLQQQPSNVSVPYPITPSCRLLITNV